MGVPDGPVVYACPMHPEVTGEESDRCPQCGMKLLAVAAPSSYACPMHPEVVSDDAGPLPAVRHEARPGRSSHRTATGTSTSTTHDDEHGSTRPRRPRARRGRASSGRTTWSRSTGMTTPANMRWKLVDRDTGATNHGIDWQFTRRRPRQAPARQRDGLGPPDAPSVPRPRRGPLRRPRPGRRPRTEPRLEGHGPRPHRRDGRHPARRHEPRDAGWRTATSPSTTRAG